MKPILLLVAFALVIVPGARAQSIELVPDAVTVPAGDSARVRVLRTGRLGFRYPVRGAFVVADTTVATVSPFGWVRGRRAGSTTLQVATDDGLVAEAAVDVYGDAGAPAVVHIALPSVPDLQPGGTRCIDVRLVDAAGDTLPADSLVVVTVTDTTVARVRPANPGECSP